MKSFSNKRLTEENRRNEERPVSFKRIDMPEYGCHHSAFLESYYLAIFSPKVWKIFHPVRPAWIPTPSIVASSLTHCRNLIKT